MESKKFRNKKVEMLMQEINELETQITAINNELKPILREENMETYKIKFFEIRKKDICNSTDFYEKYCKKTNIKLVQKQTQNLKLALVNDGYNKLLEEYEERYLGNKDCFSEEVNLFKDGQSLRSTSLLQQKATLETSIKQNSLSINCLIDELHIAK